MTRARRKPPDEPAGTGHLVVPRTEFEQELDERLRLGRELHDRAIGNEQELQAARSDYYTWTEYNEELLKRRFTTSAVAEEYTRVAPFIVMGGHRSFAEKLSGYREDVETKQRRLASVKERIPLFEESINVNPQPAKPRAGSRIEAIFVVHGHNDAAKLSVHGFLRQVTDVEALILHDQPSEGRTIIEKFEAVGSRAGFAVIVLTGDDVGRAKDDEGAELVPRGRQNVVWEFGFFVGALGRKHVAVLLEAGTEIPSDIDGLVYIPYDEGGGWKLLLAKELRAAGVEIDTEKLF